MFGRDANQKAAASEATKIFADHYPELLVCLSAYHLFFYPLNLRAVQEVLHQRPRSPHLDVLALQAHHLRQDLRQDGRRRLRCASGLGSAPAYHRLEAAAEEIWW